MAFLTYESWSELLQPMLVMEFQVNYRLVGQGPDDYDKYKAQIMHGEEIKREWKRQQVSGE